jgi:hypothetical protein
MQLATPANTNQTLLELTQMYNMETTWMSTHVCVSSSSAVICQTHDRSTAPSKTIPPLNAI